MHQLVQFHLFEKLTPAVAILFWVRLFRLESYGTEAVVGLFLKCFKMNKKWE